MLENAERPLAPATPTPAAALVLLRDSDHGVQLFMTRNTDEPGSRERNRWDFPAGPLRQSDSTWIPLGGWSASKCANMLRKTNETRSLAYFAAAGRVAFQFTGILFAQAQDGTLATNIDVTYVRDYRQQLFQNATTFRDVLEARNLEFRPDMLRPWLRWINTEWQFRRFDTVYFTAVMPPDQAVEFESYTGAWGGWVGPAEVLSLCGEESSDYISGPVRLICESLLNVTSVAGAMCKIRDISPITPTVFKRNGEWWVSLDPKADPSERGRTREKDAVDTVDGNDETEDPTSLTTDLEDAVNPPNPTSA